MPQNWLKRIRLTVLTTVTIVAILAWWVVSIAALPALPVVGVAVAGVAVVVNVVAAKLRPNTLSCYNCSQDLTKQPVGVYGVVCPECGAISQPIQHDATDAMLAFDDTSDDELSDRTIEQA
ncbi:MAG: hypothetical protein H6815_00920 [Phycisphaeraceae bacterium]|nr:hypothetical protein [Phycisphaerales bacterium]MCB9858987.1 hypothetical protein [Phycisphaeraceae bacterium]